MLPRTWISGEGVLNHILRVIDVCGYSQSTKNAQEFVELISQCPLELEQESGRFSMALCEEKGYHFFHFFLLNSST